MPCGSLVPSSELEQIICEIFRSFLDVYNKFLAELDRPGERGGLQIDSEGDEYSH